jgi:hypothetical protein
MARRENEFCVWRFGNKAFWNSAYRFVPATISFQHAQFREFKVLYNFRNALI